MIPVEVSDVVVWFFLSKIFDSSFDEVQASGSMFVLNWFSTLSVKAAALSSLVKMMLCESVEAICCRFSAFWSFSRSIGPRC